MDGKWKKFSRYYITGPMTSDAQSKYSLLDNAPNQVVVGCIIQKRFNSTFSDFNLNMSLRDIPLLIK